MEDPLKTEEGSCSSPSEFCIIPDHHHQNNFKQEQDNSSSMSATKNANHNHCEVPSCRYKVRSRMNVSYHV